MTAPITLHNARVTVVGGARSGLAVARLLAGQGARVFITERGPATENMEAALRAARIGYEFDGHTEKALDADALVVSPGVPSNAPLVQHAGKSGVPVFAEIEVASWFCKAPIVAITGTNGKTTTTSLTGYVFRQSGRTTVVAGNIGYPFSDYVADLTATAVAVLEVSSFQLDHISTFRPRVSILLNITPDHLDRYDYDFNRYAQSKYRIFENQREGDVLVYNADDEIVRDYLALVHPHRTFRALAISQTSEPAEGAFVRDGQIVLRLNQQEETLMPIAQLALPGRHNLYNSLAAAVAARVMEVRSEVVRDSLATFEGVPHRLEFVREVGGVRYVNDSKATNVNAVWYALESFPSERIILVAGGRDKGNDYASLRALVRDKVRAVIGMGESADKVMRELGGAAPISEKVDSMEAALARASALARPGDVVLLSPACSSFDMFENYEDRGDTFKRLVMNL